MVDKQLYTPISIVLAGSLIGVGLFYGLRERGAAPPVEVPVLEAGARRGEAPTTPGLQTAPEAPASAAAPRSAEPAAAKRAAELALEGQRATVVAACIPPAARSGRASRLSINLTFDANGKQIARGIIAERNDPRRELAVCATDALPALEIPAQNAPAAVDVVWSLP